MLKNQRQQKHKHKDMEDLMCVVADKIVSIQDWIRDWIDMSQPWYHTDTVWLPCHYPYFDCFWILSITGAQTDSIAHRAVHTS